MMSETKSKHPTFREVVRESAKNAVALYFRPLKIFRSALVLPVLFLLILIGVASQYLILRFDSLPIDHALPDSSTMFRHILEWLVMFAAVYLAQINTLWNFSYREYADYFWKAIQMTWLFLLVSCILKSLIAMLFFEIIRSKTFSDRSLVESLLAAGLFGALLVILPDLIERILIEKATLRWFQNPFIRTSLLLGLRIRRRFGWTLQRLIEQDSFDCMNSIGWWDIRGIEPSDISRRLRILYEFYKIEIARERRKPRLLLSDVGYYPGEKFYLLVKHLGRKYLRQKIETLPNTGWSWDGEERRRIRKSVGQNIAHPRRYYDNPILTDQHDSPILLDQLAEDQIIRRITKVGCSSVPDLVDELTVEIPTDKLIEILESLVQKGLIKHKTVEWNPKAHADLHTYQILYELSA